MLLLVAVGQVLARGVREVGCAACRGRLPEGKEGFESYTPVAPNPQGMAHRPNWWLRRPGVEPRQDGDMAGIPIVITRANQGGIVYP